jgi:lipid II:glycine glycyltransferase (peptidoglycan interpeptide bridge formation enzyme)
VAFCFLSGSTQNYFETSERELCLPKQTPLNANSIPIMPNGAELLFTQPPDGEWDQFLSNHGSAHFEQTSGWASVRKSYGWSVTRFGLDREGQMVGGVQVLSRRVGRLGTIGYVSRGPTTTGQFDDVEHALVRRVEELAAKSRWLYCVFDYPYTAHTLAARMAAKGYFAHPAGIPPSNLLDATVLVDLRPSADLILARMNSSVRRNIRRSERSGLSFNVGDARDLPIFRQLMVATCARRGAGPTPPQPDYFERLWAAMAPAKLVHLFVVRHGDEPISAAFTFTVGKTIRVWKVGWSGEHREKDPNHYMWWNMILWAKQSGHQTLDFVWIDTKDARRAASGDLSPEGFRDGTSYFKLGFGGSIYFPPPVQSKFFHPLLHWGYRFGGNRVLQSPAFRRAVSSYWAHKSGV